MKIQLFLLTSFLLLLPFTLRAEDKVTDAAPRTAFDVPKTTPSTNEFFAFSGGRLDKFIEEVRKTYGVDMNAIGSIPHINSLPIPKMRLKRLPGQDFTTVLRLYNDLSDESDHSLGKWIIKYQTVNGSNAVSALMLIPPPPKSANLPAVKAFAVKAMDPTQLDALRETIINASFDMAVQGPSPGSFAGNLRFHKETGILISTGTPEYVNLASAIITAYLEGHSPTNESDKRE